MHRHVYIYTYIHICVYIYIYTCVYIHIHIEVLTAAIEHTIPERGVKVSAGGLGKVLDQM